jgi:polysaccharide biosynthesis protein PslE
MSDRYLNAFDVHAVREMLTRHKKVLVRMPLIALALGALVFLFAPRTYRSESRIFLRLGRESVGLDPIAATGQTLALQQADRKDEVKSAIEILKSRGIVGQAVDKLGADVVLGKGDKNGIGVGDIVTAPVRWVVGLIKSVDPVSEREQAIIRVERHLHVSAERESTVIVVQYDADDPKLAQTVCDAVVDSYRNEHMRIHRSEESSPFFVEQQERLRSQLDKALEKVRSMKNELGLSSIDQRRTSLEAQFNAVELDRLSTEQQLATAQARIVDLEHRLSEVPERLTGSKKSMPNQGADLLRQQLYALQVKSMELNSRYSDAHPLVQAANEQLNQTRFTVTCRWSSSANKVWSPV